MSDKRFIKYCQVCGHEQVYSTARDLSRGIKASTMCRSCSNKSRSYLTKKYKEIPISWFEEKKRKAEKKGSRTFEFDIEYIWKIYLKQKKVCALSGLPLDFNKDTENGMVSIDRINNDKGYIKGNIQLLHKDVNFMKWTYTQEYFINMCKFITEKNKGNGEI